jgi:hypothetical protein
MAKVELRGGCHNYPELNHYECVFVTDAGKPLLGGSLISRDACCDASQHCLGESATWPPNLQETNGGLVRGATVWP